MTLGVQDISHFREITKGGRVPGRALAHANFSICGARRLLYLEAARSEGCDRLSMPAIVLKSALLYTGKRVFWLNEC
jgi:hypothetical protein